MITFIWYPRCSTCKRAKAWLDEKKICYVERDIVLDHPRVEELSCWYHSNQKSLGNFFNTSGNLYKELNLKEKRLSMSEEEQLELLGTNGMLVRRPLIVGEKGILIGFKEEEWKLFFEEDLK